MSVRKSHWKTLALIWPFVLLAAGCDDCRGVSSCGEVVPGRASHPARHGALSPSDGGLLAKDFLSIFDSVPPEHWLAVREAGRALPVDAPQVIRFGAMLDGLVDKYDEDRRMLANRTVQLQQMLAEKDQHEPLSVLLAAMDKLYDGRAGKRMYGELCQHYFNIRGPGRSHDETLAMLAQVLKKR